MWYGISLWSVWVRCPACVCSQDVAHLLPAGEVGMLERQLWYCASTAQPQEKHCCVTFLATCAKLSAGRAAVGKIVSFSARPNARSTY